jgi:uncharacterized protein involved in type VI secretion and phage assembly
MMDELLGEPRREPDLAYMPAVVVGIVTNNQDPQGMGRVKVRLPTLSDSVESNWARIAAPMAGNDRGVYFLPEIDDEVLVAFERGNPNAPFILGMLWNGQDAPPARNEDGKNDVRIIKSRSGHVIRLTDTRDAEKIEIIDMSGKSSLVFDTAKNLIKIESSQDITLAAPNGTIRLGARSIEIAATGSATVEAGSSLDIEVSGALTLKGTTIDLN